ncbi:MAG TPA: hypothetical protein V6C99_06010 [Oculatellaceae cyanobacterium]|jgi:hypothetical protein
MSGENPFEPWEKYLEDLRRIAKAFYQAYRLTGTIKMKFGVRAIEDSDGNSVIEVSVSPLDAKAATALADNEHAQHMSFLETMVPAALLGYQFILHIEEKGSQDVNICIVESHPPFLTVATQS